MKGYIFDLDGTLLDSMDVWEKIDIDFLQKRGIPVPADYIKTVLPMTFPQVASYTKKRFALSDSTLDMMAEWNAMALYAYGNTVKMKPGAKEYLLRLRKLGAKMAVATSLPTILYEAVLHNHGIYDWFDVCIATDAVGAGKTDPAIFIHVAEKLGLPPGDCVVFEDILPAVKSAKSIGMAVYGVYDKASAGDWPQICTLADGVVEDFRKSGLPVC